MNLKKENGITIVALVITVIIMLMIAGVSIYYASDGIQKAKLEDIKTNMISIKTKAKIVAEEYNFKDIENLVGTKLDNDAEQDGLQIETYKIPDELQKIFEAKDENGEAKFDIAKLYVWTSEDLEGQSLSAISIDNEKFYIVYYNLDNTNECEIYYSKGFEGKYSLSELQDI